jgi:PucR C-terminal helix-turn-helix domain
MSAAPLSDEILAQTVSAYQEHGTLQKAAAALGVHHTTVHYRLKVAAQRGLLLDHKAAMPGYVIQSVAERVDGKWIKQVQEPTGKRLANHIAAYGRTHPASMMQASAVVSAGKAYFAGPSPGY